MSDTSAVLEQWNLATWNRMQVQSRKGASFEERWAALERELEARRKAFAVVALVEVDDEH